MSFAECWWRRLARHRAIVGASVLVILVGGGWAAVDRLRAERGLELALLDAGRFRRQDQPAEARDFYRRALDIAPDHSAARAGLSWADAALLRMREEAAQARAEVAESRELLRKSGLVSSVLARWGRLFETVRRLEMGFYDSTLSDEGKREATATPWRKLERFMAETPADATSQSVMFALCGWARRLAGHDAEGLDWLARARELDPDLPYGAFFEAWAAFVRTLAEAPLPTVLFRGSGVEFGPAMADTDVLIQVKADLERWSVEAGRARVWGEGLAQDFRALLDGGQQLRTGDYAAAEESFTRVLGGGLQAFRNDVLLARARSRYLRKEFSAASEDYEEVLDTRPSHAETWYALAQVRAAAGVDRLASAVDAREAFQAAVVAMDQALGLRPGWGMALHARGLMQTDLARAEGARGADPRPLLHRAIADLDAAIGSNARDEVYRHNRGITRLALAEAIGARGGDADAAYRAAIQDFTDALAINSAYHASVSSRGAAWMALGNALAQVGGDCEAAYRQSVTDLEDVLRRVPDLVEAHQNLGIVQCALGNRCAGTAAGQAGALLETARRHFREAVRLAPGLVTAWNSLGIVHIDLAGLEKSAGRDPRPGMKEAVAALDEALKRAPEYVLALDARGVAWRNLAEAELALGGDPSEQLRCARQDHESALRVNPEYANAHHNLGRVLQTEVAAAVKRGEDPANRYEAAIVAYRAALSRAPTSVSSHYRLGITLRDFGQFLISQQRDARSTFRDAIVAFSDALDRDPGHVNARHGRATAHFRLAAQLEGHAGDPRAEYYAAEADFRHVLAEDPAVLGNQAYCGLAAELGALAEAARGGDGASAFARALSDYQQRITAFPRDLMAHVRRILVFRHLGRVAEARTACDAALEVAPEDETLKQWRKELESPERK